MGAPSQRGVRIPHILSPASRKPRTFKMALARCVDIAVDSPTAGGGGVLGSEESTVDLVIFARGLLNMLKRNENSRILSFVKVSESEIRENLNTKIARCTVFQYRTHKSYTNRDVFCRVILFNNFFYCQSEYKMFFIPADSG